MINIEELDSEGVFSGSRGKQQSDFLDFEIHEEKKPFKSKEVTSETAEDNLLLGNVIVPSYWKRRKSKDKIDLDSRNKLNYSNSMSSSHSFESSKDSVPSELRQNENVYDEPELSLQKKEKMSDVSSSLKDEFSSNQQLENPKNMNNIKIMEDSAEDDDENSYFYFVFEKKPKGKS